MSRDLFANVGGSPRSRVHEYSGGGSLFKATKYEGSSDVFPRDPEAQRVMDAMDAERDVEKARKEAGMDTPENRQKAAEAEEAERERKKIEFHLQRAIPRVVEEGWKHLRHELTDEEIRVYTTDYERKRFWGIKPAGMGMYDFWEQNDPDVTRIQDNIALTWANPLFPPPLTRFNKNQPVIWAGRWVDPDTIFPHIPAAEAPPPPKAAKSKRHQKTPELNPFHRVEKSTAPSPKTRRKKARMSSTDRNDAGQSQLENPTLVEAKVAPASDGPSRSNGAIITSDIQQEPSAKDESSASPKRPRGRPATRKNLAPKDDTASLPKRPRGRPAKAKPAATSGDASLPKSPRGRPPGKGKPSAVKGNARIAKPSQTKQRPSAPSNHKMRTRGKGTAELLQLP